MGKKTTARALALLSRAKSHIGMVELRGMLRFEAHEYGMSVDEFGFDPPAEDGLWVCVGRYVWRPAVDYETGIDEGNHELADETYRRPTRAEYARLARGVPLWRSKWNAPIRYPSPRKGGE